MIQNTSTLTNKTLTIVGQGAATTVIEPEFSPSGWSWGDRIIEIAGASTTVVLQNLAIEWGAARDGGGVNILNKATVTLTGVALVNNFAFGGGGIRVGGGATLTVTGGTFTGDCADEEGGVIYNLGMQNS